MVKDEENELIMQSANSRTNETFESDVASQQ